MLRLSLKQELTAIEQTVKSKLAAYTSTKNTPASAERKQTYAVYPLRIFHSSTYIHT